MEAHGAGAVDAIYDRAKQTLRLETDRPHALRQCIQACRKGGTVSIPGVYSGLIDKFPMGAAFAKGLTFRMGQTHMQKYMRPLLERIRNGEIEPGFLITHRVGIDEVPRMYKTFRDEKDECIKVVLSPN
jgi:threonine dehydrogenase-like Zn-dependent dehydrogenase